MEKDLTTEEKLDRMNQRLKRMEASQHVQTTIAVLMFLGVISFGALLSDVKKKIHL
jgi:hypothetical protein